MRTVTPCLRRALGLAAVAVLLAACSGAAAPSATPPPTPVAATPALTPAATPSATAAATPAAVESSAASASAAASGGPVGYAAWVERQGFGGSSGLNEVAKETHWMQDHPTEVTAFDIQTTQRFIDHLATWLDQNPATACWTEYHATVRATLGRMHDAYITAHDARAAGSYVPNDVAAALVKDAEAAESMPPPPGC